MICLGRDLQSSSKSVDHHPLLITVHLPETCTDIRASHERAHYKRIRVIRDELMFLVTPAAHH